MIKFNGRMIENEGGHKNKHMVENHRKLIPYVLKECKLAPKKIFSKEKRYEVEDGVTIVFYTPVIQYQINDVNINLTPSWKEKNEYFWQFETESFEVTPFKINRYNIVHILETLEGITAEILEKSFKR